LSWVKEERKVLIWADPPITENKFYIDFNSDWKAAYKILLSIDEMLLEVKGIQ
jgi:hypothetical protein